MADRGNPFFRDWQRGSAMADGTSAKNFLSPESAGERINAMKLNDDVGFKQRTRKAPIPSVIAEEPEANLDSAKLKDVLLVEQLKQGTGNENCTTNQEAEAASLV